MINYNYLQMRSLYLQVSKNLSYYYQYGETLSGADVSTYGQIASYYCNSIYKAVWDELAKEIARHYKKVQRLRKRIVTIISEPSVFLTFTFNDEALNSTNEVTRRRYIQRFLNSLNCNYVGNKDFGGKFHREHYHAVVQTAFVDFTSYKLGNLDGRVVRGGSSDVKIARYMNKLVNHAIKVSTKNSRIMYSRKFSK